MLLLAKSAFQIWIGIPIQRNERPTAFLEFSEEFTWKAVGLSFLRIGIPIEKWKPDRDNNSNFKWFDGQRDDEEDIFKANLEENLQNQADQDKTSKQVTEGLFDY